MERFLIALLISWIFATTACSPVRPVGGDTSDLDVCAKIGGINDEKCYVDSYALTSFPRKYCGLLVSTLGYAEKNFVGVRFYPDKTRAKHLQITGTINFEEKYSNILSDAIDKRGSGIYLAVIAKFSCGKHHAHDEVGVGTFRDVRTLATYNFDKNGNFVSMHHFILD